MNRGLMETAGVALAVAAITLGGTMFEVATAQEVEVVPEQERAVTILRERAGGGAYLGVYIAEVDDEAAERLGLSEVHGVLISDVVEDGPAAAAGLQADDILVGWNGQRLESVAQLQRHMGETPVGRSVRLDVFRDGRERQMTVTLGEREMEEQVFVGPRARAFRMDPESREELHERMEELRERMGELRMRRGPEGEAIRAYTLAMGSRGRLGVGVQSLGEQLAEYFGVEEGALVTSVNEDSPAARAGLKAGDVIVDIAGEAVDGPGDVMRLLADREPGPVDVGIVRERRARTLTVELEERQGGISCTGEDCEEWFGRWEGLAEGDAESWGEWAQRLGEWAESFAHEWELRAGDLEDWAESLGDWEWHVPEGGHPIRIEELEIGPIEMEAFHLDPLEVRVHGLSGGEGTVIRLPAIDVPALAVPAIRVPAFQLPHPPLPVLAPRRAGVEIDV